MNLKQNGKYCLFKIINIKFVILKICRFLLFGNYDLSVKNRIMPFVLSSEY